MKKSLRRRLGVAVTGLAVASAGLAMTALAAPSASADDEVMSVGNGDFEEPNIQSDAASFTSFTAPSGFVGTNGVGWAVTAGTVDLVNTHLWDDASDDGTGQSLDLNGHSPGAICQAFDTPTAFTYQVDFAMSRNGDGGSDSAQLLATATDSGGALQLTDLWDNDEDGNADPVDGTFVHDEPWSRAVPNWTSNSFLFTARQSVTTLCFASTDAGVFGPALDNVELMKRNTPPEFVLDNPTDGEWLYVGQNAQYDYHCDDLDDEDQPFLSWSDWLEADDYDNSLCTAFLDLEEDDDEWDATAVNDGDVIDTSAPGTHSLTGFAYDGSEDLDEETSLYTVVPTDGRCAATGAALQGLKVGTVASDECETQNGNAITTTKILGTKSPLPILNNTVVVKAGRATSQGGVGLARGTASLAEAKVKLPMLGIDLVIKGVTSDVTSQIGEDCAVNTTPTSSVASIAFNGAPQPAGNGPAVLDLVPGLLQVRLNQTINNPDGTVTQQAVVVDLLGANTGLDVVIGEATAGIGCDFPGDGRDDRIVYVPPVEEPDDCVECTAVAGFLPND